MFPNKLAAKKSKKRRASDDISEEEYEQRRTGKLIKAPKANNKKQAEPKKRKQKRLDKYGLNVSSSSDQIDEEPKRKIPNYIPLQMFNADKVFIEILSKASKQPDFLIMLKNLLSGCSRSLTDKKNMFKKKWKQLRNSNCSQDQYLNRQAQLKRAQIQQIHEMQRDIMTKLSYANVRGFETRNSLVQSYKKSKGVKSNSGEDEPEYEVQDQLWDKYYGEQKRLLELLMKENDFVSQDYTPSNLIKTYSQPIKDKEHVLKDQVFEDNELGLKFNNIETQENPQSTQFLFCKHFKDIEYDRVFSNGMTSFKPQQSQKFLIQAKAMSWLLQTKSDQIYTNSRFQQQTYKKYSQLLKSIYESPSAFSDSQTLSHLLQVGAYILNSVHYYQKFKLKCDLLHPLDLLLVIEKVKSYKRKQARENCGMIDERLQKVQRDIQAVRKDYERMAQQY